MKGLKLDIPACVNYKGDPEPVDLLEDHGETYTLKTSDGKVHTVPERFVADNPFTAMDEYPDISTLLTIEVKSKETAASGKLELQDSSSPDTSRRKNSPDEAMVGAFRSYIAQGNGWGGDVEADILGRWFGVSYYIHHYDNTGNFVNTVGPRGNGAAIFHLRHMGGHYDVIEAQRGAQAIVPIPGDGSCLFTACFRAATGQLPDRSEVQQLRNYTSQQYTDSQVALMLAGQNGGGLFGYERDQTEVDLDAEDLVAWDEGVDINEPSWSSLKGIGDTVEEFLQEGKHFLKTVKKVKHAEIGERGGSRAELIETLKSARAASAKDKESTEKSQDPLTADTQDATSGASGTDASADTVPKGFGGKLISALESARDSMLAKVSKDDELDSPDAKHVAELAVLSTFNYFIKKVEQYKDHTLKQAWKDLRGGIAREAEEEILPEVLKFLDFTLKELMPQGKKKTRMGAKATEGVLDISYNLAGLTAEALSGGLATPAVAAGGASYKAGFAVGHAKSEGKSKTKQKVIGIVTWGVEFLQAMIPFVGGAQGVATGATEVWQGTGLKGATKKLTGKEQFTRLTPEAIGHPKIGGLLEERLKYTEDLIKRGESHAKALKEEAAQESSSAALKKIKSVFKSMKKLKDQVSRSSTSFVELKDPVQQAADELTKVQALLKELRSRQTKLRALNKKTDKRQDKLADKSSHKIPLLHDAGK